MTARSGHNALPTNVPRGAQLHEWWRRLADFGNEVLHGGINNVLDVTLTANAATTTVTDSRIGSSTRPVLQAKTANAAAEVGAGTIWVATPTQFTVVINHANNAQTDRTFSMSLSG